LATDMADMNSSNHEVQRRLNRRISLVLRAGVAAAFVIVLAGLVLIPLTQSMSPMTVMTLAKLPAELARLNPLAVITAGILVVLCLPIVIIIISFIYYTSIRDRRMIIVCGALLAMLIFSFIYTLR
jgi:uncharacterized membrane protein